MKLSKRIIILIILSFLISSNVYASEICFNGKDSNFGIERLNENRKQSDADLLFLDRYETKHQQPISDIGFVENQNISENISENLNESENNTLENTETIVIYGYPSSWQTTLPYRLYKCTWNIKILNICSINPKGTFEGELTKFLDDTDYDITTGLEKDYHGYSVSEYLISIE